MVNLEELKQRTRSNLVYIAGGTFRPGNYDVKLRLQNGEIEIREMGVIGRKSLPEVTLDSFYIQSHLPTFAEYVTFRHETGLPPLLDETPPEVVASMPFHEAEDYCKWLGDLTGLTMRLPLESEWEYAARSRVLKPPYGTDNGHWEPPRNIWKRDEGVSSFVRPIPGTRPPNPIGLYDLHGVLNQWVSDRGESDPSNTQITKGSPFSETGFFVAIPGRFIKEPTLRRAIEFFPTIAPLFEEGQDFIFDGSATARCVADAVEPPGVSGFGREVLVAPDAVPEIFDVYVPQGYRLD